MGCSQSKIENEESLRRCRDRKLRMREAVSSRNAFAAAHSAYAIALKNTGAATSDFAHGEAPDPRSHLIASTASAPVSAIPVVQPPIENLPPPPPPLPDFNPSPLQRSASMPDLAPTKKKKAVVDPSIMEEDEDEDGDGDEEGEEVVIPEATVETPPPKLVVAPVQQKRQLQPQPPMPDAKRLEETWDYFFGLGAEGMPVSSSLTPEEETASVPVESIKKPSEPPAEPKEKTVVPEKVVSEKVELPPKAARKQKVGGGGVQPHHQHAASAGPSMSGGGGGETKRGRVVPAAAKNVSFLQVMDELDEHFLKMYESAHEVSKMLEATRMHYHSNFADNRGHIDHSARVMKVITWNKSLKGITNTDDGNDDFNLDELETHATILDKMLAWEKKLYDEVKAGELMKIEYQRKVALLNKQKKRGVSHEALEKTKSAVSHLHTRYIVDMQSMDSTVSEINHLRDDRLYPKLVELVDGMAKMWETMYMHHSSQLKAVAGLRDLDMLVTPKETSEPHHDQTIQLMVVLREWHSHFEKLMKHQKDYIGALNNWLKLNLVPIESSLKEKVSSPPRVFQPPIHILLHAWHDQMEKLPDALARGAISSFSEIMHTIVLQQEEELKHRATCEKMRREFLRESQNFDEWHEKHVHKAMKRAASSTAESEVPVERAEGTEQVDPVEERRVIVESVKARLESEVENHQRICKQVREKSLVSLKTHLPELFRAMSEFAYATSEMYKNLKPASQNSDE